jgi:hypothetical protein
MNKILIFMSVIALVTLMGAGCIELKISPEEQPIAMPSEDTKAPTPEDIGEVDVFEDSESEEVSELDVLVEEVETLEAEAAEMFTDFKNIDTGQDKNLDL